MFVRGGVFLGFVGWLRGTSRNSIGKGGHLLERPVTEPGPLAGLLRMETCGKRLLDVSFLVLRFLSVEL